MVWTNHFVTSFILSTISDLKLAKQPCAKFYHLDVYSTPVVTLFCICCVSVSANCTCHYIP